MRFDINNIRAIYFVKQLCRCHLLLICLFASMYCSISDAKETYTRFYKIYIPGANVSRFSGDSDVHLKDFTRSNLNNFKLFPWFEYAYRDYNPSPKIIDSLTLLKDHISIMVFGGSWCSDTHDLLPKFYKSIEMAKIPPGKITLIGVDRHKHSHDCRCWKYRIKRVPTFVLFYDGKQIGRVVETVKISIEADILNQYRKEGY